MKNDLPFIELESTRQRVSVRFAGIDYKLPDGENLAAALLAKDVRVFRQTPVSNSPRGPYCMMGTCYDCLVEIDGVNRQACQTKVSEGLVIMPAHSPGDKKRKVG